ncbi:WD40 repeat domain-containing protein [Actinoplanes sp. GCM10030250]|uniref:WD40 repeat domain-containing protein n=1 Tax=Actinoplanes sp. GCM10030250 TaxID=3273376 RepID=UPI00360DF82C
MRHLEDSVRAAVEDLAASAPSVPDLAGAARIRGRRIRRRRRTVVGLVAAALIGTVITPYAIMEDRRSAPPVPVAPTSAPTPSPDGTDQVPQLSAADDSWWNDPLILPGDVVVAGVGRKSVADAQGQERTAKKTFQEGNVVLDRATGRYRVLSSGYQALDAAPAGRFALVESGTTARMGIADATTGQVRMLGHGPGSGVQWSPDGTKLLVTLLDGGFRVIDAATGDAVDHDLPESRELCPDHCVFTWLPGGTEVALAQRDPGVPRSESRPDTVKSVRVYSVTSGELLRELPIPGVPAGTAAWSPDGRHVLLEPDASADVIRIAEVTSGRTVATIAADSTVPVRFAGSDTVLAAAGRNVYYFSLKGEKKLQVILPAEFAGREISFGGR